MYRFFYPPGEEGSLITSSNFKMNMQLESGKRIMFTASDLFKSIFDYVRKFNFRQRPILFPLCQRNQFSEIKDWYSTASQEIVTRSKIDTECSIGLKVIDYNEYSATSCHINDEGQLVIRLSPAYLHHHLKSMVPNKMFFISTHLAFEFCDLSNGPYLVLPCLPTNGNGNDIGMNQKPSMYDILYEAGICLTPHPFDSSEPAIYLIHGITKQTIKPEFILDNEMFKDKPLEIKFNIFRKDSKISTQTTYTFSNEARKKYVHGKKKNKDTWLFTLYAHGKMNGFKVNEDLNNKYILQCCSRNEESVHINLNKDDILLIFRNDNYWHNFQVGLKAFSFPPYIAGFTTTQEFNEIIQAVSGDIDIQRFKFCVLNSEDKIHSMVELINEAPFQKPHKMLSPIWDDANGYLCPAIDELCDAIEAIKNNYLLVRNALEFTEGTLSNYSMEGVLTLVDYSIVKKDEKIGKFDLLQYIHQVNLIEKDSHIGEDLFGNLMSAVDSIFSQLQSRWISEYGNAKIYKKHTIFIKGQVVTSYMFKPHRLTKKRCINDFQGTPEQSKKNNSI